MTSQKPKSTPSPVPAAEADSQPQSQTAVTAPPAAKTKQPTNEPRPTTPPLSVPSVAQDSLSHGSDMRQGIVRDGVKTQPRSDGNESDKEQACNDSVPPLNSRGGYKNYRGYISPPIVGECKQCGGEVMRKSRNGRVPKFCSSNCRVNHWRERKKMGKD